MEIGTVLFKGLIPARERELAVLRIGWLAGAPYEWGEHVKISQRYGVSREEIARTKLGSSAAGWTDHEAAILRGVEELLEDFALSDATWETLGEDLGRSATARIPLDGRAVCGDGLYPEFGAQSAGAGKSGAVAQLAIWV